MPLVYSHVPAHGGRLVWRNAYRPDDYLGRKSDMGLARLKYHVYRTLEAMVLSSVFGDRAWFALFTLEDAQPTAPHWFEYYRDDDSSMDRYVFDPDGMEWRVYVWNGLEHELSATYPIVELSAGVRYSVKESSDPNAATVANIYFRVVQHQHNPLCPH